MSFILPDSKDDEILYAVMEYHSRYHNLYDLVKSGLPQQIHDADLYTLDEVAEITKMSIVTIRQYVRTGKLKAIKQWKNWMVSSNEIARLLYEKLHGVKLEDGTVMLAVLAGELFEDDTIITDYKIITVNDLLTSVDREKFPKSIETYMELLVSNAQYIEAIANIENFFKRTGDIKDDTLLESELSIDDFLYPFQMEKIIYFIKHNDGLMHETPKEALQTITEQFGPYEDKLTILKMYRTILELSRKVKENGEK